MIFVRSENCLDFVKKPPFQFPQSRLQDDSIGTHKYLELKGATAKARYVQETQPLRKRVGANIRTIRVNRKVSQESLAHEIGVTPRYLGGIERGERNLTLDSVDALARKLNVPSSELVVEKHSVVNLLESDNE